MLEKPTGALAAFWTDGDFSYTGDEENFQHSWEWIKPVMDDPDNLTLRGAYADWLDEHGFPQHATRQRYIAFKISQLEPTS